MGVPAEAENASMPGRSAGPSEPLRWGERRSGRGCGPVRTARSAAGDGRANPPIVPLFGGLRHEHIERAIALGNHKTIDVQDLPAAIRMAGPALPVSAEAPATGAPAPTPNSTDLEDIERQTIERVFQQVGGDKALAGKMLGISRATLYRKLKRYHIDAGPGVEGSTASAAQNN